MLAAAGLGFVTRRTLPAQSEFTPDAAMNELMAGNRRFTSGQLHAHDEDLAILRQHTAEKQQPFAAVLSCADSRVPVEIIFDQSIGHVFVIRVAGNFVTPEIAATLEYGVTVLGIKALLVLGHSNCGAVEATIQGKEVPGQISVLYQHIQPALNHGSNLEGAIQANAKFQCDLLRNASTVISRSVKEKKLKVAAGYYDLAAGSVTLLGS
jgi:carbonic anhydrase